MIFCNICSYSIFVNVLLIIWIIDLCFYECYYCCYILQLFGLSLNLKQLFFTIFIFIPLSLSCFPPFSLLSCYLYISLFLILSFCLSISNHNQPCFTWKEKTYLDSPAKQWVFQEGSKNFVLSIANFITTYNFIT